jgi:hypothetical protein
LKWSAATVLFPSPTKLLPCWQHRNYQPFAVYPLLLLLLLLYVAGAAGARSLRCTTWSPLSRQT